jgi:hypothetical protein
VKRQYAAGAAIGCIWFLVTGAAVQIAHPHAVAATAFSTYLRGPGSGWLQAAYYIFAVGLVLLALRLSADRRVREAVAAALVFITACAMVLVAYTYTRWPLPSDPSLATRETIHRLSALIAFAGITITMFLMTPLLWRGRARQVVLALAIALLLEELVTALAPRLGIGDHGALEKVAIAGLVLWLIAATVRLTFEDARLRRRELSGSWRVS